VTIAGLEVILPHQAGNARCGDHPRESNARARSLESRSQKRGDVRPRFAGIHSDQNVRCPVFALQIMAQGASGGVQGLVIEWGGAGNTADTVCTEKLFGHDLPVNG